MIERTSYWENVRRPTAALAGLSSLALSLSLAACGTDTKAECGGEISTSKGGYSITSLPNGEGDKLYISTDYTDRVGLANAFSVGVPEVQVDLANGQTVHAEIASRSYTLGREGEQIRVTCDG